MVITMRACKSKSRLAPRIRFAKIPASISDTTLLHQSSGLEKCFCSLGRPDFQFANFDAAPRSSARARVPMHLF